MKCPYTTYCEAYCGLMNSENCNTCPHLGEMIDCTEVDTSGMTLLTPCEECKHYNHGVRPTGATPVLDWFVNLSRKNV